LHEAPGAWEIVDIDLDTPRQGELGLAMVAAGLCHSDDHYVQGDIKSQKLPMAGGHEGAGIVERVGPNTPGWEVGDHVVLSFLPSCGRCRWCASGMQNLCNMGANFETGCRPDGSFRMSIDGASIAQAAGLATFSEHTVVDVNSAIKIDRDVPLTSAVLLGCGVGTGWGSAVNSAETRPGQTIIVMGVGGIGIHAVQGAAHAGAGHVIAVDPVEFKREMALEFGATHAFVSIDEAAEFARSVTFGQGADAAIVTVGILKQEHVLEAFRAVRKAGTVVVTGVGNFRERIDVPAWELVFFQKRLQGALFGASNPTRDIPWLIDMYRSGQLRLDEAITSHYRLDDINEGYADMHAGVNIRGVIDY
jgi:S-(hydroxymethyl)glutathione dehydrogenase/alcohol dehydrogenase